uniref:Huntingtin interacting protein K n=1 Tax=Monodelphis domestica TaxID=13616 RepID=A0A5F8GAZ4_MONDO
MATEGDVELELETESSGPERLPEKPRKHDSGAADLERVTDYAEEKEIQSSNLETGVPKIISSSYQSSRKESHSEILLDLGWNLLTTLMSVGIWTLVFPPVK